MVPSISQKNIYGFANKELIGAEWAEVFEGCEGGFQRHQCLFECLSDFGVGSHGLEQGQKCRGISLVIGLVSD